MEHNWRTLVQEDPSWNLSKLEKIIIKIVPGLGIYCKFLTRFRNFHLKVIPWKRHIHYSPIWKSLPPGYVYHFQVCFLCFILKLFNIPWRNFHFKCCFLSGPYTVTVTSGNSEGRFEVKANDSSAHLTSSTVPSTSPPTTIDLNGETVLLCPNSTNASISAIPTLVSGSESFGPYSTSSTLLTVKNSFDYEATKDYLLRMVITDTGLGLSGNITVQVGRVIVAVVSNHLNEYPG